MNTLACYEYALSRIIDCYMRVKEIRKIDDNDYNYLADALDHQINWYLNEPAYLHMKTGRFETLSGQKYNISDQEIADIIEDAGYDLEVYINNNFENYYDVV